MATSAKAKSVPESSSEAADYTEHDDHREPSKTATAATSAKADSKRCGLGRD
jgi:hypothetical protein